MEEAVGRTGEAEFVRTAVNPGTLQGDCTLKLSEVVVACTRSE